MKPCSADIPVDIPVRGFTEHSCPVLVKLNWTLPLCRLATGCVASERRFGAPRRRKSRQNPQTGMSALLRRRFKGSTLEVWFGEFSP